MAHPSRLAASGECKAHWGDVLAHERNMVAHERVWGCMVGCDVT